MNPQHIPTWPLFDLAQSLGGVVVSLWCDRQPPGKAAAERPGTANSVSHQSDTTTPAWHHSPWHHPASTPVQRQEAN
ncbi:hypothetical protein LH51_16735 [Nitrincola sp. A-D6]|nr:hypothetical protein LH51_16735 [Nitrincola sp. A-D6]